MGRRSVRREPRTARSCGCSTATRPRTSIRTRSRSTRPCRRAVVSNTNLNYVRNSVKATVDAYDGTIHFYVVDPSDPIIRTYEKAFPDLFDSVEGHAERACTTTGVTRRHLRHADRAVHAVPHDRPAAVLPEGGAVGRRAEPRRVGHGGGRGTAAPVGGDNGGRNSTLSGSGNPIDPLYLMMQLPGESGQEFVLERPFVPIRKANQLSSFIVARKDGDNYGKLILYQAPDQSNAVSPARAASLIEADPKISAKFSLLDQLGSKVVRGDTQLIPIDGSIFYVRPIYVEGSGNSPAAALQLRRGHLRRAGRARHERDRRGQPPARRARCPLPRRRTRPATPTRRARPPPRPRRPRPTRHPPRTRSRPPTRPSPSSSPKRTSSRSRRTRRS